MESATKTAEAAKAVEQYPAPEIVKEQALLKNWPAERDRFQRDPDAFWAEAAKQFVWSKPWDKVFEWDGIHHQWFTGARTNITINALDRHANSRTPIAPPSSGWARTAPSASSPIASSIAMSAALPTA